MLFDAPGSCFPDSSVIHADGGVFPFEIWEFGIFLKVCAYWRDLLVSWLCDHHSVSALAELLYQREYQQRSYDDDPNMQQEKSSKTISVLLLRIPFWPFKCFHWFIYRIEEWRIFCRELSSNGLFIWENNNEYKSPIFPITINENLRANHSSK